MTDDTAPDSWNQRALVETDWFHPSVAAGEPGDARLRTDPREGSVLTFPAGVGAGRPLPVAGAIQGPDTARPVHLESPASGYVLQRVTYWTGTWDPSKEAISKEVDLLRHRHGGLAPVVAYSPGNQTRMHVRERVLTLSEKRWWTLRAVSQWVERLGEISHVFSGLAAWHWMRLLRRRPVVFTVVSGGPVLTPSAYDHVSMFVAESPDLAQELDVIGIPSDRVRLIYPGVDLTRFTPAPPPQGDRFRILFASWPEQPSQLEPRGVHALVEAARRCPDLEAVLLLRPWGDHDGTRRAVEALALPPNVVMEEVGGRSMAEVYASVHACAALFTPGQGKSTPNSLVESMACGRPVLMGEGCGIRGAVSDAGAGLVTGPHAENVVAAAGALRANWAAASSRARALAESTFGQDAFLESYAAVYRDVAARSSAGDRSLRLPAG